MSQLSNPNMPSLITEVSYQHFMDSGKLDQEEMEDLLYKALKHDLDETRITDEEIKHYRDDPVLFVEMELHFHTLSEKQKHFLRSFVKFKHPYTIVKAARGTGKTFLLSILVIWLCVCWPGFQVCIVSGSFAQSIILYSYCTAWIYDNPRISGMLFKDPTRIYTVFVNGSWAKCLTASERQVRGPHPNMLIVDEMVLVKPSLYKSALGMLGDRYPSLLIVASTPQNDKGVILFRDLWENPDFAQNAYTWTAFDCHWKDPQEIERKRRQMSKDEFITDMLGEFSAITGSVYDIEDILAFRVTRMANRDQRFFCFMGIDWGKGERTCVMIIQKNVIKKKYELLWCEYYGGKKFVWILSRIAKLYHYFEVNEIFADSSHESENERLEDIYQLNINRVSFGKMIVPKSKTKVQNKKSIKEVMITNSKEKMELHLVECPSADFAYTKNEMPTEIKKIPKGFDVFIKQMKNYHRDDKGQIVKEDDHGVDAFQLGLFGFMKGSTPVDMEMEAMEVDLDLSTDAEEVDYEH